MKDVFEKKKLMHKNNLDNVCCFHAVVNCKETLTCRSRSLANTSLVVNVSLFATSLWVSSFTSFRIVTVKSKSNVLEEKTIHLYRT